MECTQLAFSCSKLAVETPEHWEISGIILASLLLTLSRFHTLFWCFHCWLWTNKCQLGQSVSVKKFTCSKVESKIVEKGVRTPPPSPPYIAYSPLFQILSTPLTSLSPPTRTPTAFSVVCFSSGMADHATFYVLFYLMITRIYTCQVLVP